MAAAKGNVLDFRMPFKGLLSESSLGAELRSDVNGRGGSNAGRLEDTSSRCLASDVEDLLLSFCTG